MSGPQSEGALRLYGFSQSFLCSAEGPRGYPTPNLCSPGSKVWVLRPRKYPTPNSFRTPDRTKGHVLPFHVIACHVLSSPVMSLISCVMSGLVTSSRVVFCRVMSCYVSGHVPSCRFFDVIFHVSRGVPVCLVIQSPLRHPFRIFLRLFFLRLLLDKVFDL